MSEVHVKRLKNKIDRKCSARKFELDVGATSVQKPGLVPVSTNVWSDQALNFLLTMLHQLPSLRHFKLQFGYIRLILDPISSSQSWFRKAWIEDWRCKRLRCCSHVFVWHCINNALKSCPSRNNLSFSITTYFLYFLLLHSLDSVALSTLHIFCGS